MAYYLNVETLDGKHHPRWEDGKFVGDREVIALIKANGGLVQHPPEGEYDPWKHGDDVHYRPADLTALDAAAWPESNPDRWRQLVAILRDEPEYWLFASY